MKRIAVFVSNAGTGSNLQAIIDAVLHKELLVEITLVVSDVQHAQALVRAKKNYIPTLIISKQDDLTTILSKEYDIDYIVLAGWKKIISRRMIETFKNRIFNLHPGLIPNKIDGKVLCPDGTQGLWNRGLFANCAIQHFIDERATYAGSTVHFLTQTFDFGPVLERCFVKIYKNDTVDLLYKRLKKEEHRIYVKAIASFIQ